MKIPDTPVYSVQIEVDDAAVPALLELIEALDFPPTAISSYEDVDAHIGRIFVLGDTPQEQRHARRQIDLFLPQWKELLPDGTIHAVSEVEIKREDWSESWKKYFHPFRASDHIVIKPSWEEYPEATADEIILEIDPGMCFGTGSHGTTMGCLQYLDEIAFQEPRKNGRTLIDAGCGTGILSMAARRLGYGDIFAFDYDLDAVEVTKTNLAAAGMTARVTVTGGDVHDIRVPFQADVVVANILGYILLEADRHLLEMVKPGGTIILSGILNEQYPGIRDHFVSLGLTELSSRTIKEWTSGRFQAQ